MRRLARRLMTMAVLALVGALAPVAGAPVAGADAAISGTWSKPVQVSPSALYSVSCPSEHFCAAVGAGGSILTFDGARWTVAARFRSVGRLWSIDCPSVSRCVAVGEHGMVTFFDGTRWSTPADDDPGRVLSAVACWSVQNCLVGDSSSLIFNLTGQKAGPARFVDTYADYFTAYTAMSCAPGGQELCAVVDSSGSLLVWHHGRWWSTRLSTDPPVVSILASDAVSSVSCAAPSECVAVTDTGAVVRFDGTSWSTPQRFDAHGLVSAALDCPSVRRCWLVEDSGEAYSYSPAPGGTGGTFGAPVSTGLPESLPVAMSCPSTTFCVVVTGGGKATTWRAGDVRA